MKIEIHMRVTCYGNELGLFGLGYFREALGGELR